jgi:hypothetical protein
VYILVGAPGTTSVSSPPSEVVASAYLNNGRYKKMTEPEPDIKEVLKEINETLQAIRKVLFEALILPKVLEE